MNGVSVHLSQTGTPQWWITLTDFLAFSFLRERLFVCVRVHVRDSLCVFFWLGNKWRWRQAPLFIVFVYACGPVCLRSVCSTRKPEKKLRASETHTETGELSSVCHLNKERLCLLKTLYAYASLLLGLLSGWRSQNNMLWCLHFLLHLMQGKLPQACV